MRLESSSSVIIPLAQNNTTIISTIMVTLLSLYARGVVSNKFLTALSYLLKLEYLFDSSGYNTTFNLIYSNKQKK